MLCAAFMLLGTGIFASAANATEIAPAALAAAALQDTAVYALPEDASAVVGTAAAGQALNICGKTADGWYETVFGNTIGYVKSSAVAEIAVDSAMAEALAQQVQFVKAQLQAQEAGQAQTPAGQQSEAALQAQQAAGQTPLPAQPEAGQPPLSAGNLIFVGDSRTGQMGNAVGGSAMHPGTAFVACFGGGVDWLSGQKAKQDIDRFVTPGSVIILNYGVNDLSRTTITFRSSTATRRTGAKRALRSILHRWGRSGKMPMASATGRWSILTGSWAAGWIRASEGSIYTAI